jgi:hypothetical protein
VYLVVDAGILGIRSLRSQADCRHVTCCHLPLSPLVSKPGNLAQDVRLLLIPPLVTCAMIQLVSKQRLVGLFICVQLSSIALYFWVHGGSAQIKSGLGLSGSTGAQQINETSTEQAWPPAADGFIGAIIAAARDDTDMGWIEKVREQTYSGVHPSL